MGVGEEIRVGFKPVGTANMKMSHFKAEIQFFIRECIVRKQIFAYSCS
jgi:hypothetical protein